MRLLPGAAILLSLALATAAAAQGRPPAPPPPPPPSGAGPGGPPAGSRPPAAPGPAMPSSSSGHTVQHFGPVGRWWDDKSVTRTVGISTAQQKKMDTIFNANKPAILSTYQTWLSEKSKLDALSKQTQVDQSKMFAAIDSVSQAHAALEKANTQMLLEIRAQMTSDQISRLESLK